MAKSTGSKKSSLQYRDQTAIWHPYTQMRHALKQPPLIITKAKGAWLYDSNGRKFLDATASWWVNLHGHSHPKLVKAMQRQANHLDQVMFAGCTHEPAIELAEKLLALLPRHLNKVFYSDDGSTAVEVALKAAIQYWQLRGRAEKNRFIAISHGYHGDTIGAMSVSKTALFTKAYRPLLFDSDTLPAPDCPHCPLGLSEPGCHLACATAAAKIIAAKAGRTAAVIIEPLVLAAGGMIIYPAAYLDHLGAACKKHNILLIFDEVMTGFGRTGTMFALEQTAARPDIVALSKGITGGMMPLAATVFNDEIYQAFYCDDRSKILFHGHSYTANPIACAVALANLALFKSEKTLSKIAKINQCYQKQLASLAALPAVNAVRCIGDLLALELKPAAATGDSYLDASGHRVASRLLADGILARPLGNVVYLLPPYCISIPELDRTLACLRNIVELAG